MEKKVIPIFLLLYSLMYLGSFFIYSEQGTLLLRSINSILFYIGTAVIVWLEKDRLEIYNFDRLMLIIVILSGSILHLKLGTSLDIYFSIVLWCTSIVIFLFLILFWGKVPKVKLKWVLISILTTGLFLFPIAIVESIQIEKWTAQENFSPLLIIFRHIIYELSYVSLAEEVVFRGFLWGYFRERKWSENKILFVQVILFWFLHFPQFHLMPTFFITIPLVTILISMLTRFSRQVAPSIISHTLINSITPTLVYFIYSLIR